MNADAWDDMRVFLAVLEDGSLSAAARRLGLAQPTVRTRIEALEHSLGTVLFTRSPAGLTPTEAALALRSPAEAMAHAAAQFRRMAAAPADALAGPVRLSVPEFIGVEVLPLILAGLRRTHPDITVELVLSNRAADILGHEADLALRTFAPAQGSLIARRLADLPLGFFASPDYLARRGTPATLEELAAHDLIGPDRSAADLAAVARLAPAGVALNFALRTDSHPAQIAAARAGLGIVVVQIPRAARDPDLRRVLPAVEVMQLPLYLVTHADLRQVPRIRAVMAALIRALGPQGKAAAG